MSKKRIAIIGGGPAGLFAAIHASADGLNVVVYERNVRPGLKLLATGSGQCNITHNATVEQMIDHYGNHGRSLRSALHFLSPHQTMHRFTDMGLPLVTREDGKVFPASFKASQVLETLIQQCDNRNVHLLTNVRITRVEKKGELFQLFAAENLLNEVDALVLTTGGKSYPRLGSTGDGYDIARSLGHTIVPPSPALCGVTVQQSSIGTCSGISVNPVAITFSTDKKRRQTVSGPILITHSGLSGPVILNNSRYFSSGDTIEVCWVVHPEEGARSRQDIEEDLVSLCNTHGSLQLSTIVHKLGLPAKLSQWLLNEALIDGTKKAAEIGRKTLSRLSKLLAEQPFTIS